MAHIQEIKHFNLQWAYSEMASSSSGKEWQMMVKTTSLSFCFVVARINHQMGVRKRASVGWFEPMIMIFDDKRTKTPQRHHQHWWEMLFLSLIKPVDWWVENVLHKWWKRDLITVCRWCGVRFMIMASEDLGTEQEFPILSKKCVFNKIQPIKIA